MKTKIKTATLFAVLIGATAIAGAQEAVEETVPPQKNSALKQPAHQCPQAEIKQQQIHQRKVVQRRQTAQNEQIRRLNRRIIRLEQRLDAIQERKQKTTQQQHKAARQQKPRQPQTAQAAQQKRTLKFDLDGDGELSVPERAARRAYRKALQQERKEQTPAPVAE